MNKKKIFKHRQLRNFLDQHNAEFCDVLTHNNKRWLSKGNALKRLWEIRKELVMFLNDKGQTSTLLEGTNLCNFAFLADRFTHLNTLNLKLQGKGHTIIQLWPEIFQATAVAIRFNYHQRHAPLSMLESDSTRS